ncbi:MAG: PTS transporter subunit IIC [Tepidanaerobacteraceae bacterium]|jgi:PTS system galactitol-specific IIC component|nr:PTS galactitol transporter subunit IIC [Clostridiales bacterium]
MQSVYNIMQLFLNLDAAILIPIILFVLALILGAKAGRALRSSLTLGVGFTGIFVLIDLFVNKLTPAAQAMVERWSLSLTIVDAGWGPYMGAIWGSPIVIIFLPLFLIVNFVMLFFKLTNTLDIDLWNYCLNFYAGALVYVATNNIVLACIAFVISEIITLKLADLTAGKVQEYFGLPGISFPHTVSVGYLLIGYPIVLLLNKIPFINNINADPKNLKERFGIFGEPVLIGFIIGAVIGLLAGQPFGEILALGINMAAVMVLLPRMVSLLVEGLTPLMEVIRNRFQKLFPGRNINIGLDTAVIIGDPSTIAAATMLVPVSLILAAILPWNKTIPFADLSSLAFAICLITPYVNGNVVKLLIVGTLLIAFVMLPISTAVAPLITELAKGAGLYEVPEGLSGKATMITSFLDGGVPLSYLIYKIFSIF